jgi:carbamoyltransferase
MPSELYPSKKQPVCKLELHGSGTICALPRFRSVTQSMTAPHVIVGLGGLLSDAGCCVVKDGKLASAVEQSKVAKRERFTAFPDEAVATALQAAGTRVPEVGCVAIARPFGRDREGETLLKLRSRFPNAETVVIEHHVAHAASAYYASGFQQASVLSVDRAGDFRSAVLFRGTGNRLTVSRELYYPDSLGDIFNRVTSLLGYQPRGDEHKIQWLSTGAEPQYKPLFLEMIHAAGSTWPRIDRTFIDADGLTQGGFSRKLFSALEMEPGEPIAPAKQAMIASSLQHAASEVIQKMIGPSDYVCVAGGLALNALLVASLEKSYGNVFVQPAAGNAGTALGSAFEAWHAFYQQQDRIPFDTLCLGPQYGAEEIKRVLENCKLHFRFILTEGELIEQAINSLSADKIVAWMHGRMEFGPRALGNRSLLASPLNPYSTENLNVFIKHREGFRKFAASVPVELADDYFEVGPNARYLATVGRVRSKHRKTFEAALLGEDIVRVHTVSKEVNPLYHALLCEAGDKTGLPVLYNTSFNLFGDPLVCTPRDAVRSFYSSGVDAMFVGNFFLEK